MDADTAAYNQVTGAYKLPKDTETQKVERAAAGPGPSETATEVPLATAGACAEVLALAGQVARTAIATRRATTRLLRCSLTPGCSVRCAMSASTWTSLQDAAFRAHAESCYPIAGSG